MKYLLNENIFSSTNDYNSFLELINNNLIDNNDDSYVPLTTIQDFLRFSRKNKNNLYINDFDKVYRFNYYSQFHSMNPYLLNKNYILSDYLNLKNNFIFEILKKNFSVENKVFIKDNSNLKKFTSQSITTNNYDNYLKDLNLLEITYKINDNPIVVISGHKDILYSEIRCFVYNKKIYTSGYYSFGELEKKDFDFDYINKIIKNIEEYEIPYVIDFCHYQDNIFINEINCAATSGVYNSSFESLIKMSHDSYVDLFI